MCGALSWSKIMTPYHDHQVLSWNCLTESLLPPLAKGQALLLFLSPSPSPAPERRPTSGQIWLALFASFWRALHPSAVTRLLSMLSSFPSLGDLWHVLLLPSVTSKQPVSWVVNTPLPCVSFWCPFQLRDLTGTSGRQDWSLTGYWPKDPSLKPSVPHP